MSSAYPPGRKRKPAQSFRAPAMAEATLQSNIRAEARQYGWATETGGFYYHAAIPIFDKPGWLDVVLMRYERDYSGGVEVRRIIAELKTEGGKLDPEQCHVADLWAAGIPPAQAEPDQLHIGTWKPPPLEVYVWRPSDLTEAYQVIQGTPPPPTGWGSAWQNCGPTERVRSGLSPMGRYVVPPRRRRGRQ